MESFDDRTILEFICGWIDSATEAQILAEIETGGSVGQRYVRLLEIVNAIEAEQPIASRDFETLMKMVESRTKGLHQ